MRRATHERGRAAAPRPSARRRAAVGSVVVAAALVLAVRLPTDAAPPEPHERGARPAPVAPTGVGNVTQLSPAMRRSITRAIAAAAADGVDLHVTSGWRSAEHQRRLFDEAVAKYGSEWLARRWVLPPDESAHVSGEAVDVGPPAGARWLARHGVRFGLCQRYENEPWHFERLAGAIGSVCPPMEPHA